MVHILIQSETISGNKWVKRPQRIHIQHFAQLVGCGWVGLHRASQKLTQCFLRRNKTSSSFLSSPTFPALNTSQELWWLDSCSGSCLEDALQAVLCRNRMRLPFTLTLLLHGFEDIAGSDQQRWLVCSLVRALEMFLAHCTQTYPLCGCLPCLIVQMPLQVG